MGDIKDYRDKELKLYALANIFVIIYVEKIITIEGLLNQNDKFTTLLVTIFNSALFLSILYIFVLLSDSLFSEGMKNIIIYFWGHLPGETVFSRMKAIDSPLGPKTYLAIVSWPDNGTSYGFHLVKQP